MCPNASQFGKSSNVSSCHGTSSLGKCLMFCLGRKGHIHEAGSRNGCGHPSLALYTHLKKLTRDSGAELCFVGLKFCIKSTFQVVLGCAQWISSLHTPQLGAAGAGVGTHPGPWRLQQEQPLKRPHLEHSSLLPTRPSRQHPEA